jgi:hypothetical protein
VAHVVIENIPQSTLGSYILEWFVYKTFGQSSRTSSLKITPSFHGPNGMQTRGKCGSTHEGCRYVSTNGLV